MIRLKALFAGVVLLAALGGGMAQAQDEKPWSVSFDGTFVNKYIWRGQNLSNTASFQPGMAFTYGNLTVSSWSNFAHTPFGDSGIAGNHWTEHDFTVDYAIPVTDKISANVGWINYAFPNLNDGRYTNEFYGGLSFDTILQPSFTVYGDVHQADGVYYNLAIGHAFAMDNGMALNLSASAGLNQNQWIDITTVTDVMLGASVDIPLGSKVTLSPFWTYITGNESLRDFGNSGIFYFTGHLGGLNLNITQ